MPGPFPFAQIFAADPSNTSNVATNSAVLIFEVGDTTKTPLVFTTESGLPLANPVLTNANGWGPSFIHATLDQVAWDGGGFKGTFESYRGMKDSADAAAGAAMASASSAATAASEAANAASEALAGAVSDAQAAKVAAQAAANLVGAPAGAAVLAAIGPGGAAEAALKATYASIVGAASGVDDAPKLQAAINAASTFGLPLILRRGDTYRVSSPITLPSNINIDGYGALIKANAGLNNYVVTNTNRDTGNSGIVIRDLKVDGNGAAQTVQFNAVEFMRVIYSRFNNLDVTGALRTSGFPSGTNGDGLCLIYSHHNEINGGNFHHNSYDGIKLRGSNWNKINNITAVDNGRSGIQLSFYSPTGPPFNVGEGVEAEGSNDNIITAPSIEHSTGIPSSVAPITSGIYIHTGYRNIITGINVNGTRQGIGIYAGAADNAFIGGILRCRPVDDNGVIQVGGGAGEMFRNTFTGVMGRGLSGTNGRHVFINGGALLTRFYGCYFSKGQGTGTWDVRAESSTSTSWFSDCTTDGTINLLGSASTWSGPTSDGRRLPTATGVLPVLELATDPGYPSAGATLHTSLNVFRVRTPGGSEFSMSNGFKYPDAGALPPASATYRGQTRFMYGGAGAMDRLVICRKNSSDAYAWVDLYPNV